MRHGRRRVKVVYSRGQSIAVTQLKHILPQIFANIPSIVPNVGKKTQQTLFVGFDKDNNFIGSTTLTPESDPKHFEQLEQDYNDICDAILETRIMIRRNYIRLQVVTDYCKSEQR